MTDSLDGLTYNIYIISRCTHKFYAREMKKLGVTLGQFSFLHGIHLHEGVTQEGLSSQLRISKSTTAQIIRQLEESDLIRRVKNAGDKRNYNLFLTEKGKKVIPGIEKAIRSCHDMLTAGMTPEESAQLAALIARIRENAVIRRNSAASRKKVRHSPKPSIPPAKEP